MASKEAVKLAYIEFQKDFEDGEETNQWLKNVIEGLKQAEKYLEVLEIIKIKYVDIWNIKSTSTVKRYNELITKYDGWDTFNLTEREYNKVKEWLEK